MTGDQTCALPIYGHGFLIDAFRLRYLMRIVGLSLTDIRRGKWNRTSLALSPLITLVWLANRIALRVGHRTRIRDGLAPARAEVEADLRRVADSPALLLCGKLIVTATKQNGTLAAGRTP